MRFARSQIIFWSTLLLLLLQGCASTSAQPSPTHAGITPTSTIPPTPSSPVNSYRPNDHDPFQANFNERAPFTTCPSSSKPTDVCFKVSGTGTSIPYGSISFSSFDINFLQPGGTSAINSDSPNACEPTTRQGSIFIGQNTITFTASGTWCMSLVHFDYQVTGGTGTFRHEHGKGSIDIPNPMHNILEYWTGTLAP